MMKLVLTALFLFFALNPSQAKTSATAQVLDSHKRSVSMSQMRTKSVLVRAVPKAHRRLFVNNNLSDDDDGPPGPDELDLQSPYRRPRVQTQPEQDSGDVTDYVSIRLAVARARAMKIYQGKWA